MIEPGTQCTCVGSDEGGVSRSAAGESLTMGTPKAEDAVRLSIPVNDDDASTGCRFLERCGGIAHDEDIRKFGLFMLLAAARPSPAPRKGGVWLDSKFIQAGVFRHCSW